MSADNWGECPICKLRHDREEVKDSEYDGESLREDYEVGVGDDGFCYVIYSGVCQTCGASWRYRKTDIFPDDKEDVEFVRENLQ